MPRMKAVATPPGQPTKHVPFTPAEEAARDAEEQAIADGFDFAPDVAQALTKKKSMLRKEVKAKLDEYEESDFVTDADLSTYKSALIAHWQTNVKPVLTAYTTVKEIKEYSTVWPDPA